RLPARLVQADALAGRADQRERAVLVPVGRGDVVGVAGDVADLPAVAVHLQELVAGGDEGVAVAQALGVDRLAGDAPLPDALALAVVLADPVGLVLAHQDAVAAGHAGVNGIVDVVHLPLHPHGGVHDDHLAGAAPPGHQGHHPHQRVAVAGG